MQLLPIILGDKGRKLYSLNSTAQPDILLFFTPPFCIPVYSTVVYLTYFAALPYTSVQAAIMQADSGWKHSVSYRTLTEAETTLTEVDKTFTEKQKKAFTEVDKTVFFFFFFKKHIILFFSG